MVFRPKRVPYGSILPLFRGFERTAVTAVSSERPERKDPVRSSGPFGGKVTQIVIRATTYGRR